MNPEEAHLIEHSSDKVKDFPYDLVAKGAFSSNHLSTLIKNAIPSMRTWILFPEQKAKQ